jgi:hypothetical protein
MKSSKVPAQQISNVHLSDTVRTALYALMNVVLVEAQKMADKKAEAEQTLERAAVKTRFDAMTAASAVQAEKIRDLDRELAEQRVKDEAASEKTAMVGRHLAAVTDRAVRAEYLAENAAVQIDHWKRKWHTVRALFEETDPGRQEHGVEVGPPDMSPPECESAIPPVVSAKGVCTEGNDRCQRGGADFIEAAIVLLTAAGQCTRHPYSPRGKNGPLNDLRGSKSDDAAEPVMSPELLFQPHNPRMAEWQVPPKSSPPIPDELVDTSLQPKSSREP